MYKDRRVETLIGMETIGIVKAVETMKMVGT
jgi:hypothetical protein